MASSIYDVCGIQYPWCLVASKADLSKVGLVQYEWPVWSQRSRRYQLLISSVFGVHRLACGIRIELPRAAGILVHGDIIMSCMSC